MGLLTDILKDIPLSANLQEKIRTFERENDALKSENASLKDDLRQANIKIQKLEKNIEELMHMPDLHEKEKEILRYLFRPDVDRTLGRITEALSFGSGEESRYYLERLIKNGYISSPLQFSSSIAARRNRADYTLKQKGREYVIENLHRGE